MSYKCPRCGKAVESRWPRVTELAGGPSAGLLYVLFGAFFRSYHCPEHGRIPQAEFPAAERGRMRFYSFSWLLGALFAIVGLGWLVFVAVAGTTGL
jgi:hypothetical protein